MKTTPIEPGARIGQGAFIEGTGWLPGYAVVNPAKYVSHHERAEVFARLVNLFDREYATAGFLTTNSFQPERLFPG